jgi:IS5 family transposase
MQGQPGFFDVDDRLKRLSDLGDQLEAFRTVVDFEMFRPELNAALAYSNGSQGGRPPFDPVMMFKILVIQAANNLSDERTEFLINDRLSFMRFLGLALSDRVPDARTIWLFREKLTKAGAINALFEWFDAMLRDSGYIAMSGQIIDASLLAAPHQRNTEDERKAIKEGRIPGDWKDKPAKLRQKDCDARWTVKFTKAKPRDDGSTPPVDLAIPVFGYQNHISTDRGFGFIRKWCATDAAAYEGRLLRAGLLDKTNTASGVWADTAYRSAANEDFMARNGFVSHVHRKKPKGRPMPEAIRRANNAKSKIRSRIEHVFAEQKDRMDLFIRTIGIARAATKIGLANLVYNIKRLIFWQRTAPAW